ncbi:P1 family peptidase [Corynebacterium breve]|uniref:P1 family peptidase n=1 Tax=Corynebacterium breve TaxID=3049799 RepID=A0ABY8VDS2_9CORY|nr:P1 family peptidase [Corynebacterium breve]WIM67252.1 P1 family peptidase [Corynebacterium breve]
MQGALIDVPGLRVGHASLGDTGVTAIVSHDPRGMVCAVDVRGGGPGTRETDLLAPHNTVERVHAVMLAGGSAFGLAAADGAMSALEERGIGFPVLGEEAPGPRVPIVPAAVIFDLIVGDHNHRPQPVDGAAAIKAALDDDPDRSSGSVGAGCGATAGVLRGGYGQASVVVGEYTVAAGVVANPVGNVIDESTGEFFGAPGEGKVDAVAFQKLERPMPKLNTTIGVIATDAPLPVAQLQRLAMTGHDGLARSVRPAHSPLDGDTLFSVSTAENTTAVDVDLLSRLCQAAADVVQFAIVDAVRSARADFGITAWQEIAQ